VLLASVGTVASGVGLGLLISGFATMAHAQSAARLQENQTRTATTAQATTGLNESDLLQMQMWGLGTEEMQRAKLLLRVGPRASFSVANLSPVEALGIHARSDAERRKYAELFAKAFHDDVVRSLVWNSAYEEARQRLFGTEAIVDYTGQPKVTAPVGAADAAHVPRFLINDPAASARPAAPAAKKP